MFFCQMCKAQKGCEVFRNKHRQRDKKSRDCKDGNGYRSCHLKRSDVVLLTEADLRGKGEGPHAYPHHLYHSCKTTDDRIFPYAPFEPTGTEPRREPDGTSRFPDRQPPMFRTLHKHSLYNCLTAYRYPLRNTQRSGYGHPPQSNSDILHSDNIFSMLTYGSPHG